MPPLVVAVEELVAVLVAVRGGRRRVMQMVQRVMHGVPARVMQVVPRLVVVEVLELVVVVRLLEEQSGRRRQVQPGVQVALLAEAALEYGERRAYVVERTERRCRGMIKGDARGWLGEGL